MPRLLGLVLAVLTNTAFAAPPISEQVLTAAYLYNFLKFTAWPEGNAVTELTLCVTDSATFGQELDDISGRLAQNKPVRIRRIDLGESPSGCHLLFLPREEKPIRIREWLKNTENMTTLTVSNMSEFLDMGGMIALTDDGKRLQFAVQLERVKRVGLMLNAQLLQIAREVRGK